MRSFKEYAALVDETLKGALPEKTEMDGELLEACRYSLLAPGKRLRGSLALAGAEWMGAPIEKAVPFARAVECVHAYSLIHDDLPAMDNDSLRRGLPTNHVVFGEAMAILAGDALLSHGLLLMANAAMTGGKEELRAMQTLTQALGICGMVGGQAKDVLFEKEGKGDRATLYYIQENKTAALICAPLLCGLILGGANEEILSAFSVYGRHLGVAFQIADDLLDVTAETGVLGKTVGKDEKENKLTEVRFSGFSGAKRRLQEETELAVDALNGFQNAEFFTELARQLVRRSS